jgi:hypothetical protein
VLTDRKFLVYAPVILCPVIIALMTHTTLELPGNALDSFQQGYWLMYPSMILFLLSLTLCLDYRREPLTCVWSNSVTNSNNLLQRVNPSTLCLSIQSKRARRHIDTYTCTNLSIEPKAVFTGYNSRPNDVDLPEPSWNEILKLWRVLRTKGVRVLSKEFRKDYVSKYAYRNLQ